MLNDATKQKLTFKHTILISTAGLSRAIHGFVEKQAELPKYGQLGCQGFILFRPKLELFEEKTSAFIQVGDQAFRHVELLLDEMLFGTQPKTIYPGGLFVQLNCLVVYDIRSEFRTEENKNL